MNRRILHLLYRALTFIGLNPSLHAADLPDSWLVEHVEGEHRIPPGRALDLGCGAGRNTLFLARHGWDVTGIDMLGRAVELARSRAVGDAATARFLQGDVTRLADLDLPGGYSLIVDSGCYYGLPNDERDAFAAGVTEVAAKGALLLMAGFTKIPGLIPGISEEDLRRRFSEWELGTTAEVPAAEIMRHTPIPPPLKAAIRGGRVHILRFELIRTAA